MSLNKNLTITTSFIVMFMIAIASGIRGLLVPNFMSFFEVSSYQIGLLFSFTTAISVIAAFMTSPVVTKLGYKQTVIFGLAINCIAFYLTSKTNNFVMFTLGYGLITFGVTFSITCLNTIVTVIKVTYQAVLVNMMHFFFGLGVTISQKVGGDIIETGYNWQDFFLWMAIIYLLSIFLVALIQYPQVSMSGVKTGYKDLPNRKFILLLCTALGLYVAAELQTGNWMINYLNQVYGYTEGHAGTFAAIFFGTFSVGRFLGGFIAEKLGYVRSVSIFLCAASVLYVAGLLMGESGLLILSGSGLFFSLIYPTVTLYIADLYPEHKASAISLVSAICNFISLISSFVIGYLNDFIGVALAFWMIPICLILSAIMFIGLHAQPKKLNS